MKCTKKVSDHTGFFFYPCGKPAKFRVWFADGPMLHYCGIHANKAKRQGGNAVPLEKVIA